NRPRNSISRVQKQIFYSWLLDHTANPFPSENERIGVLAHDSMTERQFKYWFANIRCRQFTKHRDLEGNLYFVPAAKFYESCIRLGLPINHEIPATVQRDMKLPRQPSRRQQ
ncbi:homeodomain super, partial [Coemansia spiralis]